ncbi:hypothetical protein [Sphingomonas panacis]|nr:hypothetical protein [Sphingomonas panacis]
MRRNYDRSERVNDRRAAETYRLADMVSVTASTPEWARLNFTSIRRHHLGLALRWDEARRQISAALRGVVKREWIDGADHLLVETTHPDLSLRSIILRCTDALVGPARRPLTPRLLMAALSITNKERLRWTKDGRLPRSGSVTIRAAHPVSVSTYGVDTVAELVADPSIIAAWRRADASAERQATG